MAQNFEPSPFLFNTLVLLLDQKNQKSRLYANLDSSKPWFFVAILAVRMNA
jgi:hypothetical protein